MEDFYYDGDCYIFRDFYNVEISVECEEDKKEYAVNQKDRFLSWFEKNSAELYSSVASILVSDYGDGVSEELSVPEIEESVCIISAVIRDDDSVCIDFSIDEDIFGDHWVSAELSSEYKIESFCLNG